MKTLIIDDGEGSLPLCNAPINFYFGLFDLIFLPTAACAEGPVCIDMNLLFYFLSRIDSVWGFDKG